ncbi:MAG: 6-phosphogluconate dehydrogenase (decarboxylating) [Dehalococcoidia bacterium]|nr:6-phosphogluconate dehydrogenase (decarboxylating) [Dehalococcoidia bacterium]
MNIIIVGLGKMGGNIAKKLLKDNHNIIGFDSDKNQSNIIKKYGAKIIDSLEDINSLDLSPKIVWMMLPSGKITQKTFTKLLGILSPEDIIIDGGNSNYKLTRARFDDAKKLDIHLIDCGTSGGIWGLKNGYCLTIGGEKNIYEKLRPIFNSLTPKDSKGNLYVGESGSGHYVKMIHNGIEYGMMQAIAEGIELLKNKSEYKLNISEIVNNWKDGSVIKSWLIDLISDELSNDKNLDNFSSYVDDSGEGRWTIEESIELGIPTPVITAALFARFRSRQIEPISGKVLSAMRKGFGGHEVKNG